MPGPHDVGGKDFGRIDRTDRPLTPFDVRVDALQQLMGGGGARLYRVDELRRAIESLAPGDYYRFGYYQKWLSAMRILLTEKRIIPAVDIERRVADLRGRQ
ncbi:MAG: nitrile hydratase subunit beta [Alphaproteobacteria bacterium]|nr:nitrile hydratase subunit beta [Alphaproteobacteria bacterium]